jgi:formate dehydrogenase major subunit
MKKHNALYTPEMVASITGVAKERFLQICEWMASTAVPIAA